VVMGETLEASLAALFGGAAGPRTEPTPEVGAGPAPAGSSIGALVTEANQRYQAALQAQRDVDWARYGEEFKRLGEVLEKMRAEEGRQAP
jgi:uncharacterized membrane protein (UPF0182 family)